MAELDPEHALVYLSLRDRGKGHRWPADGVRGPGVRGPGVRGSGVRGPGVLAFSWALVLDRDGPYGTAMHTRLCIARAGTHGSRVIELGGGFFDRVTIALLQPGLSERLAAA